MPDDGAPSRSKATKASLVESLWIDTSPSCHLCAGGRPAGQREKPTRRQSSRARLAEVAWFSRRSALAVVLISGVAAGAAVLSAASSAAPISSPAAPSPPPSTSGRSSTTLSSRKNRWWTASSTTMPSGWNVVWSPAGAFSEGVNARSRDQQSTAVLPLPEGQRVCCSLCEASR